MTDQAQSEILGNNPIGKGLDAFRSSFNSICEGRSISCTPDALGQLDQEGTVSQLRCSCAPLTVMQISKISLSIFCPLCETFLPFASLLQGQAMAPSETIS